MFFDRLARRWRPLSLRSILVIPFVVQLVGAVSLTGWLASRSSHHAVREAIDELTIQVNDKIASHIEYYLKMPHLILQANGVAIETKILDSRDFTALERHFFSQLQFYTAVDYLYFGQADGQFIGVQNLSEGMVSKVLDARSAPFRTVYNLDGTGQRIRQESAEPYSTLDRPWYLAAVQRGRPTWSPIFTSAHLDVLQIAPAIPLYGPNDELLGVLASNLRLSKISQFLDTLTIGKSGFAVIIEPSGDLVATSTGESVADPEGDRIPFTEIENPTIASVAQQLQAEFAQFDRITQPHVSTYPVAGEVMHVRTTPFRDGRGLEWTIITIVPESDFMAEINASHRRTIALCFAAAIGVIGSGVVIVRWVTRPIRELSDIADRLAQGDWTSPPIRKPRSREVAHLVTRFNHMSQQLQVSFEAIERRNLETIEFNGEPPRLDPLKESDRLDVVKRHDRELQPQLQPQLELQPVNLREAVAVVFSLCAPQLQRKPIEMIEAIAPTFPLAYADEHRLQHILYTLIGYAIKLTEQGFIGVTAAITPDQQLAVTIVDTGIGIDPAQQARLFDDCELNDFELNDLDLDGCDRADSSTAHDDTAQEFTLVKECVELQGGTLTVNSVPGSGSQFCLTLPIAEKSPL